MKKRKLSTMKTQTQILRDIIKIHILMKMNGQEKDGEVMNMTMSMVKDETRNSDLIVMRKLVRKVEKTCIHILRQNKVSDPVYGWMRNIRDRLKIFGNIHHRYDSMM